jgi:hypothetical protein
MAEERESMNLEGDAAGVSGVDPELERNARNLGWVPEAEWRGDKSKWVDANTFLEKAEHIMPILRRNNAELQGQLSARDRQLQDLSRRLEAQDRTLKVLAEQGDENSEAARGERITTVRAELRQAIADSDVEAQAALQEELSDLKLEQKLAKERKEAASKGSGTEVQDQGRGRVPPEVERAFQEWLPDNQWYNDPVLAGAANATAMAIQLERRNSGQQPLIGRALLDEMTKRIDARFHISGTTRSDKVEGDRGGARQSQKNGSRYSDLPAEAKTDCDADARRFVGPNKKYKDIAAWRARYAEVYFKENA